MSRRLRDAPWWVQTIVSAAWSSGVWALAAWLVHWSSSPTAAVITGAVVGAFIGARGARDRRELWDDVFPLPHQGKAAVEHAAHRGPIPEDAGLREAARQFLEAELDRQSDRAWGALGILAAIALIAVLVTGEWAAWFAVASVILLGVHEALTRQRWTRRMRLISHVPAAAHPAGQ